MMRIYSIYFPNQFSFIHGLVMEFKDYMLTNIEIVITVFDEYILHTDCSLSFLHVLSVNVLLGLEKTITSENWENMLLFLHQYMH